MRKNIWKYLLMLCVFALVLGSVMWVYNTKLENQRAEMQKQVDHSDLRTKQMQRRYVEQKAVADRLKRNQSTLEGKKSELMKELEDTKKAVTSLEKEKDVLKKELEANTIKLETCGEERKALADKNSEVNNILAQTKNDYEKEISQKESENKELESRLSAESRRLEISNEKNARLCIIAEELLEKYESKGAFSSILQKEPVLQFKKVELEKYIEEYRDRIKKNKQKQEVDKGS